jgi:hypothetical protein
MQQKFFPSIKVFWAALVTLMLLVPVPAMFADTPPKLDKIPEVKTDKKKPSDPKDKLPNVTMCPGKWGRLEAVFKYQADQEINPTSEDDSVAETSYKGGGAQFGDRSYVVIHSGANDGDAPITTTVTVTGKHVKLGGKSKTNPKSQDFKTLENDLGSFTVTVLPGKKPPCGVPKTATGSGVKGKPKVVPPPHDIFETNHNEEDIKICVGQTVARDLTTGFNTDPKSLKVINYDDPSVASATSYVHKEGGKQTSKPAKLFISGLEPGHTRIFVELPEIPFVKDKVSIYQHIYNVTVATCTGSTQPRSAVPEEGYVMVPGGEKVTVKPDEEPKEKVSENPPNESESEKKILKNEGVSFNENQVSLVTEVGLTDANFNLPEGLLTVHFPEDMAVGDEITASIDKKPKGNDPQETTTNGEALGKYTVEVETTKTFVDDKQFSLKIPSEAATALATWLLLKDPEGHEIRRIKVPVHPAVVKTGMEETMTATPEQFKFPRTCETGKPIQFKGPFQKELSKTAVKIDGQEARILAKSPRSLVVDNPSTSAGIKDVQMISGDVSVRGPIENRLGTNAPVIADDSCKQLMTAYKAELFGMVDKGWKPNRPPSHGVWTTVLDYNLTQKQTVENVRVLKSSGYGPLDQSAISRVYQLQGTFKPLPSCFSQPALEVEHTFKVVYH